MWVVVNSSEGTMKQSEFMHLELETLSSTSPTENVNFPGKERKIIDTDPDTNFCKT